MMGAIKMMIALTKEEMTDIQLEAKKSSSSVNRYQLSVCRQLSIKFGQNINELLAEIPSKIDEALDNREFEKAKSLYQLKSDIMDLILISEIYVY